MNKLIDLSNQRFTRLTVIHRAEENDSQGKPCWICRCDCGNEIKVRGEHLRYKKVQSCGCFQKECRLAAGSRNRTHNEAHVRTPEYRTWVGIKDRCTNPRCPRWEYYGGRGITVCDRWLSSFENFLNDMGRRPDSCTSIDRINNNGNYEPRNCRWSTRIEQRANRRDSRKVARGN